MSAPLSISHLFGSFGLLSVFRQPTHHAAQLCAYDLDGMLLLFFAQLIEVWASRLVFRNPFAGKLPALNVSQRLLHGRATRLAHNLLAAGQIALPCGVRG